MAAKPDGTVKGRMVVDIRGLNSVTVTDAYPAKNQDDTLAKAAKAKYITVLDAMAFYYQWRVAPEARWALTIVTPRGQYTFNCAVMGFKNSNAYVQRQMDLLLDEIPDAECYCDDIIIASDTLEEHKKALRAVFTKLRERNISIGPSKSYVAFPSATVLGRYVDSFSISSDEDRLAAISKLTFPENLKDLDHFIGATGYLRNHVPMYGVLINPLQEQKRR
jgi:hypothetical protein